jgi:hypothetical protein
MKEIQLTQNKVTIVDDEDFEYLNQFKWCADKSPKFDYYFATKRIVKNGKASTLRMHRLIMGAKTGEYVDHINHDTLDNRRCNLRLCSNSQNNMNKYVVSSNTSGFKGVNFDKRNNKWRSYITKDGKQYGCGYYNTAIDAALAYDEKAKELFKEFACTNFGSKNSPYILITT